MINYQRETEAQTQKIHEKKLVGFLKTCVSHVLSMGIRVCLCCWSCGDLHSAASELEICRFLEMFLSLFFLQLKVFSSLRCMCVCEDNAGNLNHTLQTFT